MPKLPFLVCLRVAVSLKEKHIVAFASLETPREKIEFTLNSRQLVYIANYKATHADQSALQKN